MPRYLISFCPYCDLQQIDLRDVDHLGVTVASVSEAIKSFVDRFVQRNIDDLWIKIWTFFTKILKAIRSQNLYPIDDDFIKLETELGTIGNYAAVHNMAFDELVNNNRDTYQKILEYVARHNPVIFKVSYLSL